MKQSVIYTITNKLTNRIYVGFTTNFDERSYNHRTELLNNRHKNYHLQKDYFLYGKDNFIIEIIDDYPEDLLIAMEHYWCIILDTHNLTNGYNIAKTNPCGIIMTPMQGKFQKV